MLSYKETKTSFQVTHKGDTILFHSLDNPLLKLGISDIEMEMNHGSFIKKIKVKKNIPCSKFIIKSIDKSKVEITFPELLTLKIIASDKKIRIVPKIMGNQNYFEINLPAYKNESIYGIGEQHVHLNLKNKKVPVWIEEQGLCSGRIFEMMNIAGDEFTTYFNLPLFNSSRNYSWFIHTYSYSEFNFKNNSTKVKSHSIPKEIIFTKAKDQRNLISHNSKHLQLIQPKVPNWINDGCIVGLQGGSLRVKNIVNKLLKNSVKINGIWIQDWCGSKNFGLFKHVRWNYEYDSKRYPKLKSYIKQLNKKGIHVFAYINPYLAKNTKQYIEARDKGYLIKNKDGKIYDILISAFRAGIVDLSNKDAFEWFKTIIKTNIIELGFSGWMADYGEWTPTDITIHNKNIPTIDFHNLYPVLWAKCNYEALKETDNLQDKFFFMRSGHIASNKYVPMFWAGDQLASFDKYDGYPSSIKAIVSSSYSGIGLIHSDIGGFHMLPWTRRTKKLLYRSLEQSVFSPFMRTHEGSRYPRSNLQVYSNKNTRNYLAKMSQSHYIIKQYIKHIRNEYYDTGLPMIRSINTEFEEIVLDENNESQYMFGNDILVCPVVKKGEFNYEIPEGKWINIWTGSKVESGKHKYRKNDKTPVFYRMNSSFANDFSEIKNIVKS